MEKIVNLITEILNIKKPTVKVDNSKLKTATQMGALEIKNGKATVYLKNGLSQPDKVFTLAHELRHYYQIVNGLVDKAHTVGTVDTKTYNEQEAEIDANAFAKIIMVNFLGITPLFNGLDEWTKFRIDVRAKEIAKGP